MRRGWAVGAASSSPVETLHLRTRASQGIQTHLYWTQTIQKRGTEHPWRLQDYCVERWARGQGGQGAQGAAKMGRARVFLLGSSSCTCFACHWPCPLPTADCCLAALLLLVLSWSFLSLFSLLASPEPSPSSTIGNNCRFFLLFPTIVTSCLILGFFPTSLCRDLIAASSRHSFRTPLSTSRIPALPS